MADKTNTIMTGARAIVQINEQTVGLFANCSWSLRQDKVPIYILGRYNPAELTAASQEPVSISLTGYRSVDYKGIGSDPKNSLMVTPLDELLNEGDFSVSVFDRQSNKLIFKAYNCKVIGYSSGVSARGISDMRLDIIGIKASEENTDSLSDDEKSATNLP